MCVLDAVGEATAISTTAPDGVSTVLPRAISDPICLLMFVYALTQT